MITDYYTSACKKSIKSIIYPHFGTTLKNIHFLNGVKLS